jgi:hypothetical protein
VTIFCSLNLRKLKGKRYDDVETTEDSESRAAVGNLKTEINKYFQQWQEQWNKRVCAEGIFTEMDYPPTL